MAAPKVGGGKRIAGLQPKVALAVVAVVAIGVWYYLKHRAAAAIPTQTQTTPQVAATGTTDPNATGGVAQGAVAPAPDLSFLGSLLDSFLGQSSQFEQLASAVATAPPTNISTYYNAPYQSPSTNTYTANYSGAAPAAQQGNINPAPTGLPPGVSAPGISAAGAADLASWTAPVFNSNTIASFPGKSGSPSKAS